MTSVVVKELFAMANITQCDQKDPNVGTTLSCAIDGVGAWTMIQTIAGYPHTVKTILATEW